ncbi:MULTISPECIES: excinuclease ABC subunit UvrA [Dictyoglomus]|uniref:UvrABC system protein A n=1 Tax=Dictyoglomus turgidum (strain DSM 6724 / Z-1310) TaxID=515635 RepID=B8E083_DICTD|nr:MULTISPECIES: excinuclease ABC subunit UvrA [Dictyoglomus]ACK42166.1 excinuclease ABC, A subunit [Dictyoglomus turgidum DSM 6724]HBU32396.1 excinuclease ABC subunit UvrA [Dictyoglomus sp.]
MSEYIKIRGAREHNLKNINIDLPRNKLIVFTGISGSGKSSLAFDTIYAEGQRRYVESLSTYARQFLGQLNKPDVDVIEGLSPAISIDQKTVIKNPRSTVGTVTEIYDYLRLLFANIGKPYCPFCGIEISAQTSQEIVEKILALPEGTRIQILSPLVRGRKGEYKKLLDNLRKEGFLRVKIDGEMYSLEDEIELDKNKKHDISVVIDRLVIKPDIKTRLSDSIELALKLSEGLVIVEEYLEDGRIEEHIFSENFSCPICGFSFGEITPRLFSFNSPYGACPACSGLGGKKEFDPDLILDYEKSISEGAIIPWGKEISPYYKILLANVGKKLGFNLDTPLKYFTENQLKALLYGVPFAVEVHFPDWDIDGYRHFEGLINIFNKRYEETESEDVKNFYERFMVFSPCNVCNGTRLKKEALSVYVNGKNIAEVSAMNMFELKNFLENLNLDGREKIIASPILKEILQRVNFLIEVGVDYLTLDRSADTLSGGESQRVRLATQIGSGLVGVIYVLDEPSIGLHPRDNEKLIKNLKSLRDLGNTVIVVEHDEEIMRSADFIVDIGPGAGEKGGEIVVAGPLSEVLKHPTSITAQYLRGEKNIPIPKRRRTVGGRWLEIKGARARNLKNIDVKIPLGTFVCLTGVSGSGKSTLVEEIIYPALQKAIHGKKIKSEYYDEIKGTEYIDKVIVIDQSPIGRTPRSNPATYTNLFTEIRELFAQLPEAKMRGYKPGRFSFNVKGGRCEACKGEGMVKVEMHFLPDIYIPCEVCKGKRYNSETLEITYKGKNIADVLEMSVEEALKFFENFPSIRRKLETLYDVGLGYIKLGQPATTLSGGEAQRIKLAAELSRRSTGKTFYILDEPTTGLHFADVEKLLNLLHRLVDQGNTVLVIEHNLDVIKTADYIIDLGPEGGDRGGEIIAEGTPEEVAMNERSYTGKFLRRILSKEEVKSERGP